MAKSKDVMVLINKGSFTSGKINVRKGGAISKEQFEGLSQEHKALFTDKKTAEKVLKRKVREAEVEESEETPGE